jgi:replicative DNA helicase
VAKEKLLEEPQSLDAERAVLGAMLLDREAIGRAIEFISDKTFYLDSHRILFKHMIELYDKNVPVDVLTLTTALKNSNELERAGDAPYLTSLLESVISSANIAQYSKIVRDTYTLRQMLKTCNQITESVYEKADDVDELLDSAERMIFTIKEHRVDRGFLPVRSILTPAFETIERLSEQKTYLTGLGSGFRQLDRLTSGFQNSDLIIVAARPSMGKSAFALNVASHLSTVEKQPVGIFSLEMAKEQLAIRLLCSEARVDSQRIRTGFGIRKSDWANLTRAAGSLSEAQMFIDDTPNIALLELRAKARRLKAKNDIKLLIIDYMQLIAGPRSESRQQEISYISRSLKALARELDIPVIVASQLSRAIEHREDKKPVLADLRESGAIEQDADLVLFIHRAEMYGETSDNKGLAEVIIGKHRNGPVGKVELSFIKQYTRFENLATAGSDVIPEDGFDNAGGDEL